jgi:pyridoxine kinase
VVLIDPVVGDAGRLYVAEPTAEAIRDQLLPLATIATPNLFELLWLTADARCPAEVAVRARQLGPPTVVVTSARQTAGSVATLLVSNNRQIEREMPKHHEVPHGAGDLFAGLFLGHWLNAPSASEAALNGSLGDLDRVLAASAGCEVLKLAALDGEAAAWP